MSSIQLLVNIGQLTGGRIINLGSELSRRAYHRSYIRYVVHIYYKQTDYWNKYSRLSGRNI